MTSRKKNTVVKMVGLVLLGVTFASKIKEVIRKYVPAAADLLDKAE
jgi:hypothetical protein